MLGKKTRAISEPALKYYDMGDYMWLMVPSPNSESFSISATLAICEEINRPLSRLAFASAQYLGSIPPVFAAPQ